MTTLTDHLEDYLRIRRSLGAKLVQPEHDLHDFVTVMGARRHQIVTAADAVSWAVTPQPGKADLAPSRAPRRIEAVRGFSVYLKAIDDSHEIVPAGAFGFHSRRTTPHIWAPAEIHALMTASRKLSRFSRHIIYPAVFGLLVTTGMRVGEALHLARREVDLDSGVVTIVGGKSRNPRLTPLHPTTTAALREYDDRRPRQRSTTEGMFFTRHDGQPLSYCNARYAFRHACRAAGLTGNDPARRIHDLRHTFAVDTLLDWHRGGVDVDAAMPTLSTYLGHVNPKDTYWYLTAVPELMSVAADTLAKNGAPLP